MATVAAVSSIRVWLSAPTVVTVADELGTAVVTVGAGVVGGRVGGTVVGVALVGGLVAGPVVGAVVVAGTVVV